MNALWGIWLPLAPPPVLALIICPDVQSIPLLCNRTFDNGQFATAQLFSTHLHCRIARNRVNPITENRKIK